MKKGIKVKVLQDIIYDNEVVLKEGEESTTNGLFTFDTMSGHVIGLECLHFTMGVPEHMLEFVNVIQVDFVNRKRAA